jgi:hypothetical protein
MISPKNYVVIGVIGYMRGERYESFEGVQLSHSEETLKFAGNVSVKL